MNQNNIALKKKPSFTDVKVHSLSHDGRGIATFNNKTLFVSGALAGETVSCQILKNHKQYYQAKVIDVITPSAERIMPPCSHFSICGGCSLQHMSMKMQLELKTQTIVDQLKHFGNVSAKEFIPPLNAATLGYRRKARLSVKYVIKKNKLLVGFREKGSHYLAELNHCMILHPKIGERLHDLSELIMSLEQYREIPQIEVAMGDDDAALIFRHLVLLSAEDKAKLIRFAQQFNFHLYLQPNSPLPLQKLWPADNQQRLSYTLPCDQLEFLFHPLDFTQIHLEMNRLMVMQAITLLDLKSTDHVLDLFCGIGNFTLPIAKRVTRVTGIEGCNEMVARANQNAQHNNISNTHFYAANLFEVSKEPWMKQRYNKILLDPPRLGAKEILSVCDTFAAEKIVYVSCNSATFARDAGILVHQLGYQLTRVGIMNMFPHTAHIETIAVFEK